MNIMLENQMKRIYSILVVALLAAQPMLAYKYVPAGNPGETNNDNNVEALPQQRSAACAPATALRDIEWNNVKALIETSMARQSKLFSCL